MDTKEREKLITDAVAEFEAGLRSKATQFEATHAERKLNISVIEALWGESRRLSDEILKRVYTELTNTGEEKLVQEKNCARRSGNKRPEQGETGMADTDYPGSIEHKAECFEGTGLYHPAENIYSFGKYLFQGGGEAVYPLGGRT
ncbi:MAG: hypothetical protein LBK43_07630 [Treponema sp.]|jgi:hypothetical protein|nr:hypothetical protein [Treponema sp.]